MKRLVYIILLVIGAVIVTPVLSWTVQSDICTIAAADNNRQSKAAAERQKEAEKRKKENEKKKKEAEKKKQQDAKKQAANQKKQDQAQAKAAEQREKENAKQQATAKKETPAKQQTTAKKETPAKQQTTAKKETPAKQQATAKKETPAKQQATVHRATSAKSQVAVKKVAPKPIVTAEQQAAEYQARVEAVERENKKIAAYLTRDIEHRIGWWGQVGYSAIFPTAFTYDANNSIGFQTAAKGGVGGGIGLGYQLRYKKFLFTTGAEFEYYSSLTELTGLNRSFKMQPYNTMTYTYTYPTFTDNWQAGYVQIPLLFGMELSKWYWQAGAKIGLNVMGSSVINGTLTTSINDVEMIENLRDMANHALVTDYAFNAKNAVKFGINTALAAEVGINFDPWTNKPKANAKKADMGKKQKNKKQSGHMHYRLALFAEYGVLNIQNADNYVGATNDAPANYNTVSGQALAQPEDLYRNIPYTSALGTTSAQSAKLNPFLVGVKFAMFYELPRQQKKMLPMPKEPMPRLITQVLNTETGVGIAGVQVNLTNKATGKVIGKTTNSQGAILTRMAKGDYDVTIAKVGFMPADTVTYSHLYDLKDTLRLRLTPEPKPIIYTLTGFVFDAETNLPLEANVYVSDTAVTKQLYAGTANDEGMFVTPLTAGNYRTQFAMTGYMPYEQIVHFTQDTMRVYLTKIKEGIKVKINNLFFATNKTYILPESETAMAELATFLLDNPTVTIRITGHTDAIGSDASNMTLSLGRAKSVRNSLIERGVDANRIEYEGKGESEPVADNDTEEGRALNRRVEFTITGTAGEDIQQIY